MDKPREFTKWIHDCDKPEGKFVTFIEKSAHDKAIQALKDISHAVEYTGTSLDVGDLRVTIDLIGAEAAKFLNTDNTEVTTKEGT